MSVYLIIVCAILREVTEVNRSANEESGQFPGGGSAVWSLIEEGDFTAVVHAQISRYRI